jgi:hypothetical protein
MPAKQCPHPSLVRVVNAEFGGQDSTTYRCDDCRDLLTVSIKPFEIKVTRGRPPKAAEKTSEEVER